MTDEEVEADLVDVCSQTHKKVWGWLKAMSTKTELLRMYMAFANSLPFFLPFFPSFFLASVYLSVMFCLHILRALTWKNKIVSSFFMSIQKSRGYLIYYGMFWSVSHSQFLYLSIWSRSLNHPSVWSRVSISDMYVHKMCGMRLTGPEKCAFPSTCESKRTIAFFVWKLRAAKQECMWDLRWKYH